MEDAPMFPGVPEKEDPRSPPFPQISGLGPSSCIGRPQQLSLESPRHTVSRLCYSIQAPVTRLHRLGGLNTAEMYFRRLWRWTSRVTMLAGPLR